MPQRPHLRLLPPLLCLALAGLAGCELAQHGPTQVALEPAALLVAAGDSTCAILGNGNAACWGANLRGELGGLPSDGAIALPTWLPLDADPVDVAIGPAHGCAVLEDGGVSCWGENADGLLGGAGPCAELLGDGGCASTPVVVAGLAAMRQVVVGGVAAAVGELPRPWSCALTDDGRAMCWGDNRARQLGDATPGERRTPDLVLDVAGFPLRDLTQLAAVDDRACGLGADGRLWCWGDGAGGAAVVDLPTLHAVALGAAHACAIVQGGDVMCWGDNSNGQAGDADAALGCDPEQDDCTVAPTRVAGVTGATSIAVGLVHSCAVTAGGVECWGSNQTQQLGTDAAGLVSAPVAVALPGAAVAVAAGRMHTCALGARGEVWCWGDDGAGQVGVPE